MVDKLSSHPYFWHGMLSLNLDYQKFTIDQEISVILRLLLLEHFNII